MWCLVLTDKSVYPLGTRCHSTLFYHSSNLKSVREEQISFHTLAFLTFRWQLLSWHMCVRLLSTILATTAALTVHRHRGHSVDLCDSLWSAKRYQVEGPKQKQFSGAEGNILRSSELHFFPTFPLHDVWSLTHSLYLNSCLITAPGIVLHTDFLRSCDVFMQYSCHMWQVYSGGVDSAGGDLKIKAKNKKCKPNGCVCLTVSASVSLSDWDKAKTPGLSLSLLDRAMGSLWLEVQLTKSNL